MIIQQIFTINYQKIFETFFGGINFNVMFLVLTVLSSMFFFSYFLTGFQKEFLYKTSLDKADMLNI